MHKKFKSRFCANIAERLAVSQTTRASTKSHLGIFERESEKKNRHTNIFAFSLQTFFTIFCFPYCFSLSLSVSFSFCCARGWLQNFCPLALFSVGIFSFCCRRRNGFISCTGAIKFVIWATSVPHSMCNWQQQQQRYADFFLLCTKRFSIFRRLFHFWLSHPFYLENVSVVYSLLLTVLRSWMLHFFSLMGRP